MPKEQPSYYANIPADVRYDDDLTANEKLMYGEITCLSNKEGYCWSSNDYFSDLYNVTKNSVSRWLRHLEKKGYINRVLIRNDKKQVIKRKIYITGGDNSKGDTSKHESVEGIDTNVKDNTTRTNTTSNNNTSCSDSESQNDKVKFDKESKPYQLAMYLKEKIKSNIPNQPTPKDSPKQMESWSLAMDRLHRLGTVGGDSGYSWDKIKDIIDWCQQDDFWYKNILSATKLRKQAVKLEMRMKEDNGYSPKQMEEEIDYYADLRE